MKYFELPSAGSVEGKTVIYSGSEVTIPAHHHYIAIAKLGAAAFDRNFMVSFANHPVKSDSGYQWMPADEDFTIIGQCAQVPAEDLINSLRAVDDSAVDMQEACLSNAEELAIKIKLVLQSDGDADEKLHAIFCPQHGVFAEFMEVTMPMLENLYGDDEDEDEDDLAEQELGTTLADLIREAQTPETVKVTLADLLNQALSKQAASDKPRVRVISGGDLSAIFEAIGLNKGKA